MHLSRFELARSTCNTKSSQEAGRQYRFDKVGCRNDVEVILLLFNIACTSSFSISKGNLTLNCGNAKISLSFIFAGQFSFRLLWVFLRFLTALTSAVCEGKHKQLRTLRVL